MIWQLPADDQVLAAVQFATSFEEMDAISGRNQTTKGIWLAKSSKVASPTTLVMDLEGSDGRSGPEAQCLLQPVPSGRACRSATLLLSGTGSCGPPDLLPRHMLHAILLLLLSGCVGCRERGEDDTSFERQSSLFALAVADVLLVNMWAKDVGREAGSGKPLLKTIFQVRLPKPP